MRRIEVELGSNLVRSCPRSSACHIAVAEVEEVTDIELAEVAGTAAPGAAVGTADMRFDRCSSRLLHHGGES